MERVLGNRSVIRNPHVVYNPLSSAAKRMVIQSVWLVGVEKDSPNSPVSRQTIVCHLGRDSATSDTDGLTRFQSRKERNTESKTPSGIMLIENGCLCLAYLCHILISP